MAVMIVLAMVALGGLGTGNARGAGAGAALQELVGELGNRAALLSVYRTQSSDGEWRITGEYLVLDTLQRRFLVGKGGPELSVTTLKEGKTTILFGHPPTATLQGVWRNGTFEGTRYGPGGQLRERFTFRESFPSMADYSAAVQCAAGEGAYSTALAFVIKQGRLRPGSLSWTSRDATSGDVCVLGGTAVRQLASEAGLRFGIGAPGKGTEGGRDCTISVRHLGEALRVSPQGCGAHCGNQARIEPILIDDAEHCRLLRPVTR